MSWLNVRQVADFSLIPSKVLQILALVRYLIIDMVVVYLAGQYLFSFEAKSLWLRNLFALLTENLPIRSHKALVGMQLDASSHECYTMEEE